MYKMYYKRKSNARVAFWYNNRLPSQCSTYQRKENEALGSLVNVLFCSVLYLFAQVCGHEM